MINYTTKTRAAPGGLLGGLAGGAGMALYLTGWGVLAGEGPRAALGRFDPAQGGSALNGALAHLAVSGGYGALFALLWRGLRPRLGHALPGWAAGMVYGLLLLALARLALIPLARSPLAEIPAPHFAVAHLVYGALLGALSGRP